jgi:uncharacterized protein GlcG (DUF336 family)
MKLTYEHARPALDAIVIANGDHRYTGWGGGLPVATGGAAVGAVAVSSAPEAADVEMAGPGVAAVLEGLTR